MLEALFALQPSPSIICTDGNGYHPQWGFPSDNFRGFLFHNWLTSKNLNVQNNGEPTFETNHFTHLFLTITSPSFPIVFDLNVYHDNFQSDHFPILMNSRDIYQSSILKRTKYKLIKANRHTFRSNLTLPKPPFLISDETSELLSKNLHLATLSSILQTSSKYNPKFNKYCWSEECITTLESKNNSYKRYIKNLGKINLWI